MSRKALPVITVLAIVALLAAACGGGGPTAAPAVTEAPPADKDWAVVSTGLMSAMGTSPFVS